MNTTNMSTLADSRNPGGAKRRSRVSTVELLLVTWRQHRTMLLSTTVFVAVLILGLVLRNNLAYQRADGLVFEHPAAQPVELLSEMLLLGFGALIAAFWTAPLLSREFEAGTHLLAWSQDVAARRLIWTKTCWLGLAALVLAAVLGFAGMLLAPGDLAGDEVSGPMFEPAPTVQVGHVLFGFALGLVLSLLIRRTVLAMAVSLVGYLLVRVAVALYLRPHYLPPVRTSVPYDPAAILPPARPGLPVRSGYLDRMGNEVDTSACYSELGENPACVRRSGVVRVFDDYQPADRLGVLRLIETGVFVVLAALLLLLVWRLTRRLARL